MGKILNVMLSAGSGGLENTFVAYTKALIELGHEVDVVVDPKAEVIPALTEINTVKIYFLKQHGLWDCFARYKLTNLIKILSPKLALVHGGRAMSFMFPYSSQFTIIPIVANYNFKRVILFSNIIVMTNHLKNAILKIEKSDQKYIHVLPHPVIVSQVLKPESKPLIIGSLGRFVSKKGFDTFLKSLALLKQKKIGFKAILAGTGREEKNLRALAKQYQLDDVLSFPGWLPSSDFFQQIDIFCLPSYHEPFGIVIIEALASGKAIVSTSSEGPSEILTPEKNALMIPAQNVEAMANALYRALSDDNIRESLKENALATYENHYAFDKIKEKLGGILKKQCHYIKSELPH